jgi:hypothetical protein
VVPTVNIVDFHNGGTLFKEEKQLKNDYFHSRLEVL